MGETRRLQLAADQGRIVVTVRQACQKTRRIVRQNPRERIRHIIGKNVLVDAIPYTAFSNFTSKKEVQGLGPQCLRGRAGCQAAPALPS